MAFGGSQRDQYSQGSQAAQRAEYDRMLDESKKQIINDMEQT